MRRRIGSVCFGVALATGTAAMPALASAFCGFYVGGAESEIFNNATMVVLMRTGTTTVLSMQNDYQGPPEDFAMVVPVPVVLREANVKTLPREVFDRVDQLAAPRLVEYWEQDPCNQFLGLGRIGTIGHGGGAGSGSGYGMGAARPLVRVEAEFAVGEYEIVILSADDSTALETWLRDHRYRIPEGAAEALRPYVEGGMKFFVAKVDITKVRFEDGRAVLSPLRVHYESPELTLPVRLGMLNSSGTQDLIVHVLARNQRYEVANFPNVTIPTNIDVAEEARPRFGEFYAALFDSTLRANQGAVVTEYAWQASSCDPCPGPTLSDQDIMTLGADVAPQAAGVYVSRVTNDVAHVEGPAHREVLRRIVRRHINEVRYCHDLALGGRPASENVGHVVVHAELSETGAIQSAEVTSGLSDGAFRACVQTAVRRWSFPAPGASTQFDIDFGFDATERALIGGGGLASSFVLTRLHYRYRKGALGDDLVFRTAGPITGGREAYGENGKLEETASDAFQNNFQGRYAIRHRWEGAVECESPTRDVWGGPPTGAAPATAAATGTALAPRGTLRLADFVRSEVPGLDLATPAEAEAPETAAAAAASTPPAAGSASSGCGSCAVARTAERGAFPAWAPLGVLLLAMARGRRRLRLGALACCAVLLACACGGSGDDGSDAGGRDAAVMDARVADARAPADGGGVPGDGGDRGDDGGSGGGCAGHDYAFCEDFESAAPGTLPSGWSVGGGWEDGDPEVTDEEAHHGARSLRSATAMSGHHRAERSIADLGAVRGTHWGRVFYLVHTPAYVPPPGNVIHNTMVALLASDECRVVDTVVAPDGSHQFLFNIPDDSCCAGSSYDYRSYDGEWHCAEWRVDATDHSYQFFFDGTEVSDIAFTYGPGDTSSHIEPFETVALGWRNYQIAETPYESFFDDLAIDDERIGCK